MRNLRHLPCIIGPIEGTTLAKCRDRLATAQGNTTVKVNVTATEGTTAAVMTDCSSSEGQVEVQLVEGVVDS